MIDGKVEYRFWRGFWKNGHPISGKVNLVFRCQEPGSMSTDEDPYWCEKNVAEDELLLHAMATHHLTEYVIVPLEPLQKVLPDAVQTRSNLGDGRNV